MRLSELLKRDNNNLDIFRLLAAALVIYGHAYAIAPQEGRSDVFARLLGYDYSGSLAVKLFFFLSGLVVTNSLLHKRDVAQFVIARFFRIWPALLVVTALCALVLGPLVTALPLADYWGDPQTWRYVTGNLRLSPQYALPGVFANNPHAHAVNGSLWTIVLEVGAYLALLALFLVGALRSRWLALAIVALVLLDPLLGNRLLFTWRTPHAGVDLLAPCFAAGALLALWQERVVVGLREAAGLVLLFCLFRASSYAYYFLYAALFASTLYLAGQPWLVRLRLRSDVSYGVYLWGFPVQQTLQYLWPEQGLRFNQGASLLLALLLGYASWHLVEKQGIALGQRVLGGWVRWRAARSGPQQEPGQRERI